jgi:tetratricopeptide (TPR) repeat protein
MLLRLPSFGNNGEGHFIAIGVEYERNHNFIKAAENFEKALEINPKIVELYKKIGDIYHYKVKDLNKAIDFYIKGLRLRENDYGMNLNLMYAYFKFNDVENGLKKYKLLSKLRKNGQKYSFPNKIVEQIISGLEEDKQIKFCKEYLLINPTDKTLIEFLSDIYFSRKDYINAKQKLDALIDQSYANGETYFKKAVCNYYLGLYNEALENFKNADKLGENVPEEYLEMVKNKMKEPANN